MRALFHTKDVGICYTAVENDHSTYEGELGNRKIYTQKPRTVITFNWRQQRYILRCETRQVYPLLLPLLNIVL